MKFNWRDFLARLPLPMLALAASYGVYSYAVLFVPEPVAVVQAAAFELTYIGLAVVKGLDEHQRKRATAISIGAVVVSILYNSLAGFFHRQPAMVSNLNPIADAMLAVLHGAPLAWVAYLVADLLLHTESRETIPDVSPLLSVELEKERKERTAERAGLVEEANRNLAERDRQITELTVQLTNARQAVADLETARFQPTTGAADSGGSVEMKEEARELVAVTAQPETQELRSQVRKMRNEGASWKEIEQKTGVKIRTAQYWLNKK